LFFFLHVLIVFVMLVGQTTSLELQRFIEVSVPSQENEWSSICVLEISILPLSTILIFHFLIVPVVWYFFVFKFITTYVLSNPYFL